MTNKKHILGIYILSIAIDSERIFPNASRHTYSQVTVFLAKNMGG